tara:strand:- start:2270 stop:3862 length:1593 start_codon:yes stop_codon:yes gene_type:complete
LKVKTKLFLFLITTLFLVPLEASVENKKNLAEIYFHYSNAEYDEAIKKVRKLKQAPKAFGVASYWEGKIYSKTQEYEKANFSFKNALKRKVKIGDLFYLYGQSLYASQNLEIARKAFLTSAIRNKYKEAPSYYYSGIISELLEDNKKAKKYYKRILRIKNDNDKLKKPALFQIANLNYKKTLQTKNEQRLKRLVIKTILPQFEKARLYKQEAPLTAKVVQRINEIKVKHKIDLPGKMINGRPIPKKPFSGNLSVGGKNDSNILSVSSEDPSLESASFTELSTNLKYQFNAKKTYSFITSLGFSTKQHIQRDNPSIYQNDNLSVDSAFSFIWEQTTFNKMSKTMVDLEYNHTLQDPNSTKKLVYYSKHLLLSIGHEFQLFSTGSTAFKFKFKKKEAYSTSLDSNAMTINLNQNLKLGKTLNLAVTFNADFNVYKEAPSSDTDEYKLSFAPTFTKKSFWGLSLAPSYSFSITNNVFDSTKGIESSHDPSLTITKPWKNLSTNINYAYTKKVSKDSSSSYTKHIMGVGLTYNL